MNNSNIKSECDKANSKISWNEDNVPISVKYDDIYFSTEDGLKESEYVFIEGCRITERWQDKDIFTIVETGFGTGLNFLATYKKWKEAPSPKCSLQYISIDINPLSKDEIKKSLSVFPELQNELNELLDIYPATFDGVHKVFLANGIVSLTLFWGDILWACNNIDAPQIDAIYLDGFSPKKNPDMWNDEVFKSLYNISSIGTVFSTFTASSAVRRGLEEAGFKVDKRKGYKRKREMLVGYFGGIADASNENKNITNNDENISNDDKLYSLAEEPWFKYNSTNIPTKNNIEKTATIIGGGIAGCSAAYSLAKRGWKVTIIEKNSDIALDGSGNNVGVLFPALSKKWSVFSRFTFEGYRYSSDLLKSFLEESSSNRNNGNGDTSNKVGDICGMLQFAKSEKDFDRISESVNSLFNSDDIEIISSKEASNICGIDIKHGAAYYKNGSICYVRDFCKRLADHKNIDILLNSEITSLNKNNNNDQWEISLRQEENSSCNILNAKNIIIANAHNSLSINYCEDLEIDLARGQLTYLPEKYIKGKLNSALCYGGYIVPDKSGGYIVGSTFDKNIINNNLEINDHKKNIDLLKNYYDINLESDLDLNKLEGRVGYRAITQDRMPIIGKAPDFDFYKSNYHDLTHGKHWKKYPLPKYHSNLYFTLAHGSRGLITAPIAGEIIAAMLNEEVSPVSKETLRSLHPARFLVNNLRKAP